MLVVALTGGIGSGKTRVSDLFAELGAGVIDADLLSRELTSPGSPALPEIAGEFGAGMLRPDGALDRAALRQRVFADPAARGRLEGILHPRIKALMLERLARLEAPYAVLVIPLLLETGQQGLADRVLVVDAPEEIRIDRVRLRSGLSEAEIQAIIASQASRDERLARADDIIDNSGGPERLRPQVEGLHRRYLTLSEVG